MAPIQHAVFPVAGLGTRFLPATKASPKEMLPVVDKPLIQYAVEEAVAAGITELVFINGRNKRAIPDHFDTAYELETTLEKSGKHEMLEMVRNIVPPHVTCIYIRQAAPLGLGHAVLCARPVIGSESQADADLVTRLGDRAVFSVVVPAMRGELQLSDFQIGILQGVVGLGIGLGLRGFRPASRNVRAQERPAARRGGPIHNSFRARKRAHP